jgi:hypothetical protein
MTVKVHVIHDLWYGYNEPTDPKDLQIPDVDIVILNGNLSYNGKRSIHYAFQIAKMYPDVHFVYNEGYAERYLQIIDKWKYELEDSMRTRLQNSTDWPKNLHWKDSRSEEGLDILLRTGQTISVWTCFGFPDVVSYDNWQDTWFYRNVAEGQIPVYKLDYDTLPGTDLKIFGDMLQWATPEFVRKHFQDQENKIRNWEVNAKHYGILVTHLNPYNDPRLENVTYKGYNIHWYKRLWVTTHLDKEVNYLGGTLYSNPGRGSGPRSKFLEVDRL